MIKLGNVVVNEEFIQAVEPWQENGAEKGCLVLMRSGDMISAAGVSMDAVCFTLAQVGALASSTPEIPPQSAFSPAEQAELYQAAREGYYYVAKDKTGIVYAFRERPEKHGAYWGRADGVSDSQRLKLDYEALSFEDADALWFPPVFGWRLSER